MVKNYFTITIILILIGLSSCSKKEKPSPELYYIKAMRYLKSNSYNIAAENFEKIDDEFPFSKWALKGKVMATYARYKEKNYSRLFELIEDFIRLNPNSEYIPYMLYMKGLSYYNQIPDTKRAQDDTQKSSYIFRELVARFPNDFHSEDAIKKLQFIDEHLAGYHMSVGRNKIKEKNYLGAIHNFTKVVKFYRQTKLVPESYYRLAEIYYKIGLTKEGKNAKNILNERYHNNFWTKLINKKTKKFDESY